MDVLVTILIGAGLVFFLGGAVGMLRLPDFYTRLHAAGKMDSLATLLMMLGLALFNLEHFSLSSLLVSLKLMLIVVFIYLASPTATHAIVDAGVRAGLAPWAKGEDRMREEV